MSNVPPPIDGDFSIDELRLPGEMKPAESQYRKVCHHLAGKFLRGPIPWSWLSRAGRLPGKALHVAVAIRFLDGFEQTGAVDLSPARLRELGVSRTAGYRALDALEGAQLVRADRHRGKAPRVMIIEISEGSGAVNR